MIEVDLIRFKNFRRVNYICQGTKEKRGRREGRRGEESVEQVNDKEGGGLVEQLTMGLT